VYNRLISEAIQSAVEDAEQPESVAEQLISWLHELTSGNETLDDNEKVSQRCEFLYKAVEIGDLDGV